MSIFILIFLVILRISPIRAWLFSLLGVALSALFCIYLAVDHTLTLTRPCAYPIQDVCCHCWPPYFFLLQNFCLSFSLWQKHFIQKQCVLESRCGQYAPQRGACEGEKCKFYVCWLLKNASANRRPTMPVSDLDRPGLILSNF